MKAEKATDLNVYRLAMELQQLVFDLSLSFPPEERFSLTDQIRRSSRSIGANLCEAWAKRRYPAHFVSKLSDADGEQEETGHWFRTAHACGYLDPQTYDELSARCHRIGAMLGRMIVQAESWCKNFP